MEEDNKIVTSLLKQMNSELAGHWMTKHVFKFSAKRYIKPVSNFDAYRKKVMMFTEAVRHLIPEIEKRNFKHYHIDHKVSIWYGFKNGIPAEVIGGIGNLRMLPAKENMLKGRKCEQNTKIS